MNNIICNNAYGILGLLPNASQKEISRRVKEIEKYLQIDENPQYDFDYGYYNKNRTLQNIHDAFFNISNINNQVMHHFFRVYASNEQQLNNLHTIANNFTPDTIKSICDSVQNRNLIIDKNIAILLALLLLTGINENVEFLSNACIDLWHLILNNEKYLKDYKRVFLLDDEVGIEETLLDNLKEPIVKELTQIFSDISKLYNDNQILSRFIDKFQLNDNIFHLDTVEEIYDNIYKSIKIMDSMNISEDGIFDDNEKRTLKQCLQTFQDEFNKLIDLGLYDNEKTIILRDLVATKIRIQILDLYNNLSENKTALKLMQFALYIVGTNGLKDKLSDELNSIESNISVMTYIKPIMDLLGELQKKSNYINMYELKVLSEKIRNIYLNFNQDYSIPSYDKNKAMDIIAIRIRSISIDLHNKFEKFKESQYLLNLALEIAKSQKIKDMCLKDLVVINDTVSQRCGFNGFLNSSAGGCLMQIIGYGIVWLVIAGIVALCGG